MERIPRGLYTPEFRLEAVKLVEGTGMSIVQAAKQLSVPKSSLHKCNDPLKSCSGHNSERKMR